MKNAESIKTFFDSVVKDMATQNQKVPVSGFTPEADEKGGQLLAPDWFKYMILGRGPGKQPPPEAMLKFVQNNPGILASSQAVFKGISENSLAFLIGRKIGREGTDVFLGKRKGVDLLGAIDNNMPELLESIGENELIKIKTSLVSAL